LHGLGWLVQNTAALCSRRKECNKYDLTDAQCSDWAAITIGPGGLLLLVPDLFAVPVFSFISGVAR